MSTISVLIADCKARQEGAPPAAKREYAIAITALEDAEMRIVRGNIMCSGRYPDPKDLMLTIHGTQLELNDSEEVASAA